MLGSVLGYAIHHPRRLLGAVSREPADVWDKLCDHVVQQWEYRNPVHRHQPSSNWQRQLRAWLRAASDSSDIAEFQTLFSEVVRSTRAMGIEVGPESFAGFNDGDAALLRAIWLIMRHSRPKCVVETGVGHGFTSRFILEAMERSQRGRLYSIDRPPLDAQTRARVGIVVPPRLRHRWGLVSGSSRRELPALLSKLGTIDFFVHDSLHTKRNVRFELDRAWVALRPGGFLIVDDVDSNGGFRSFCEVNPGLHAVICEAEPVRLDERRFNKKGLFAVVKKPE